MRIEKIIVVGLGYVGLPLARALAEKFDRVIGFDTNESRVETLKKGIDPNEGGFDKTLAASRLLCTSKPADIVGGDLYIVAVPTPVGGAHVPDLKPLESASEMVGRVMRKGAIVCYESTVYPGVTEDVCVPILERTSGLKRSVDFKVGYSPERINPGDKVNRLDTVVKIVSGEDEETAHKLKSVYETVALAGIHVAPSIKVAEAAKVIENTQRDINIALMNELAIIFDRMGISTHEVLSAARTKWNFLPFAPGLVGGHCIGVDPYYLTYKSQELGYIPQVILSGRGINDSMGAFVAQKTIKLLCSSQEGRIAHARIGILGLTFKENVPDIRNSKVVDIVRELDAFGASVFVHDPLADPEEAMREYGVELYPREQLVALDAVILAVRHRSYEEQGLGAVVRSLKESRGVFVDIKSAFPGAARFRNIVYWAL